MHQCPFQKRKRDQALRSLRHVRTQPGGGLLEARERALTGAKSVGPVIMDFQPPEQ